MKIIDKTNLHAKIIPCLTGITNINLLPTRRRIACQAVASGWVLGCKMVGATLWKRLLNGRFDGDYIFDGDSNDKIKSRIIRSVLILRSTPFETLTHFEDFGCLAPPFPLFWIELPVHRNSERPTDKIGILVESEKIEDGTHNLVCTCFGGTPNHIFLVGAAKFSISPSGKPIAPIQAHANEDTFEKFGEKETGGAILGCAGIVCDILQLLSCKNVSLQSIENDVHSVYSANRKYGKRSDNYRYHILVVRPPGAHKDSPAQEIGVMPRHMCRGHFAEYGPEFGKGLLFGRLSGRFYVPPHLKGNPDNGIIEKDYQIGPSA